MHALWWFASPKIENISFNKIVQGSCIQKRKVYTLWSYTDNNFVPTVPQKTLKTQTNSKWKVKIWLFQEQKELSKWNKRHFSLFQKYSPLDFKNKNKQQMDTTTKP